MNARAAAAQALTGVIGHAQSLNVTLPTALNKVPPPERALVQELCYGVLRFYPRLAFIAAGMLQKPLKSKDRDITALILVGLYQLMFLNIPAHAAVTETVAAVRDLGKEWAAGLVNALLRRFQREAPQRLTQADEDPVARTAHPRWWLTRLQAEWPAHWQAIVAANNQRPPLTLRVNAQRQSREDYLALLADAGRGAHPVEFAAHALSLDMPVDVAQLPGFSTGWVSVQDAAAQLAAPLLELAPGQRVLDACAAPGGKTTHLLEVVPEVRLLALDNDAQRLERVHVSLQRLGLRAELRVGDAGQPLLWWDGTPFDRILLDAPCSGSGVIRRHPDIKQLRTAQDIDTLAQQQRRLLAALWPLLARGGILLYATCSVLARENQLNLAQFLDTHADARDYPINAAWGYALAPGRQILPGDSGMDGFYYARLMKL